KRSVPVLSLKAAAGQLSGAARSVGLVGWRRLAGASTEGSFIARVRGDSMEPRVPNGAMCLFVRPAPGPMEGRIFLVEQRSTPDAGLGGPFALKRIGRIRVLKNGNRRVTLVSLN